MRHVIVGGGQAAVSAAAKLRELDAGANIVLVSDEAVLPYQRPPLSKAYLSGDMPLDRLTLRPQDWFDEQRIDVRLSTRATAIEGDAVVLDNGESEPFDRLLLAIGSRVRRLPEGLGDDLENVFYLRSTADIDAMQPALDSARNLVIVGGGYIGLEVAAVARKAGLNVTVLEAADRILQRVACAETSAFFRELHASHGVMLMEGQGLDGFEGDGAVERVRLSDDTVLDADIALVGIGVEPNEELASAAGIACDNGILVDDHSRTSNPKVFAAGDCASFEHEGRRIRLESVPNAIHQAETAAANMAGQDIAYEATPWFWSDQYDVKLQIAGLGQGHDRIVVRPGKREGAVSHWYFAGDRLLAVDAMNDAPAFMSARKLIEGKVPITPQDAKEGDLRTLIQAAAKPNPKEGPSA